MAVAANALGYASAADELVRAGLAYAVTIDNKPLMARLRIQAADIACLHDRLRQARDLAQGAIHDMPVGPNAARAHLIQGIAAARLGDADAARGAVTAATGAREQERREPHDDLLEIGGAFGFSYANQDFYSGAAIVQIPGAEPDAIARLEVATQSFAAGPGPGEEHSLHCKILAHADLATARLRAGRLDAAIVAIEPVMALPPAMRTEYVVKRLALVSDELTQRIYRSSPLARDTGEQIEEYCRDTIVTSLNVRPGGPA
jgi:hypothetical protein